ncbi:hypothetical protein DFH09DRAFT_1103099 [Mycena vulgaris]|nr:hypothetical protein DFH09DRAFT_1103099 [Mycena vulgaris]
MPAGLFRSIDLCTSSPLTGTLPRRASLIFTASPHLRPYVRQLTLNAGVKSRVRDLTYLISILDMLQNVAHLTIWAIFWSMAPPNLRSCLAAYFGHPSLRSLSIIAAFVPARVLLHAASSVPHLELRDVTVEADGARPTAETLVPQLTLTHLQFSYCNYHEETRMTPMDILSHLHGLKRLEMELAYGEDLDDLTKVAQVCKHGLKHFSLSRRGDFQSPLRNIIFLTTNSHLVLSGPFHRLPNLPPLGSLRFIEPRFFTFSTTVGLSDLLATVPTSSQMPRIQIITISITYADFVAFTGALEFDFDAGLMSHPYLRRMHFHLVFKSASSIDGGSSVLGEYTCEQLPRAQENRVLIISCVT